MSLVVSFGFGVNVVFFSMGLFFFQDATDFEVSCGAGGVTVSVSLMQMYSVSRVTMRLRGMHMYKGILMSEKKLS